MSSPTSLAALQNYGASALNYTRGATNYQLRPDYPQECIKTFMAALNLDVTKRVLDLGAGTGKLACALLTQLYPGVALDKVSADNFHALEVAHGMRVSFATKLPHIQLLEGTAENTSLPDSCVDSVVVGTAFHWFQPEALNEIYRILKVGGTFGLIWNMLDPDYEWVKQLRDRLEVGKVPNNHDTDQWKANFRSKAILFSDPIPSRKTHTYTLAGSCDDVIQLLLTFHTALEMKPDERESFIRDARHILATHPQTKGRAVLQVPFRVEMYTCTSKKKSLAKLGSLPEEEFKSLTNSLPRRCPSHIPQISNDQVLPET